MKNTKNILAVAMIAMTISTYANANNFVKEDKAATTVVKSLPESAPAVETPAPQKSVVAPTQQYSAPQKASIVELKLKSDSNK